VESRRLWRHVTESLHEDDVDKATEHKRIVSEFHFADLTLCCISLNLCSVGYFT